MSHGSNRRRPGSSLRWIDLCVSSALLVWASEHRASAYIDPGSGALLWQAILAGFFGAVFYFRKLIARLAFRKKNGSSETRPDSE